MGADVLPVALGDIAVDRLAFLHELREDVTGPVDGLVRLNVVEYLGLHHIDARIHGVGENLPPRRLLQEPLDLSLFIDNGDAEFEGIGHAGQAHRDECALLLVEIDEISQIEVGEGITRDDQEGIVLESFLGILDAARGTEGLLFIGIGELHSELFSVTEIVPDQRRQELHGHDSLIEPMPLEQPQHMLHDRPVDHRQERLGHARGHGAKACALATSHHDGLHVGNVLLEETTVWPTAPERAGLWRHTRLPTRRRGPLVAELNRPLRPPSPTGGPEPHTGCLPTNRELYPILRTPIRKSPQGRQAIHFRH